jgi:hypothetical protein
METLIVAYVLGIGIPGWPIGVAGENVFGFDLFAGMFFWPLMLCALVIYGLCDFIRKVARKFRAEK